MCCCVLFVSFVLAVFFFLRLRVWVGLRCVCLFWGLGECCVVVFAFVCLGWFTLNVVVICHCGCMFAVL